MSAGISIGIDDMIIPETKKDIVAETRKPLVVMSGTPHPLVGENAYLQTNGIDLYVGAPLILLVLIWLLGPLLAIGQTRPLETELSRWIAMALVVVLKT